MTQIRLDAAHEQRGRRARAIRRLRFNLNSTSFIPSHTKGYCERRSLPASREVVKDRVTNQLTNSASANLKTCPVFRRNGHLHSAE